MWLLLLVGVVLLSLLYLKNKRDTEASVTPVAAPAAPAAPTAPIILDYQPQTCPSGFSFIDGQCEADCPPGQKKLDGMCVIGSAQGPTANFLYKDCPTGMRPDGNDACILDEQVKKLTSTPRQCPPGTSMVNGVCEADCPGGSKKINGKCYSPAVTDLSKGYSFKDCPEGMTVEDGFCVIGEKVTPQTPKPKTCPPGFSLVGNNCEQDCTTGYKKIDGKCYPTSVDTIIKQKLFKNCPDGFRTDPLTCQKDVQVKRVDGAQKSCPTGWSQSVAGPGGMCMKDCTEGYKKHLGLCYHPSVDTALLVKGPSYKGCPDGFRTDPLTCQKDVQVKRVDGAQKSCPTGWSQSVAGPGGMCMKDCTGGQKKHLGLCYDPAVDTNLLVKGYSYKGCPDGFRTDPVTCQKDVQIRRVDGVQKSCPAGWSQTIAGPGGMCQQNCSDGYKKYGLTCYHPNVDTSKLSRIPDKGACNAGDRDDGTSCFSPIKWNSCAYTVKGCKRWGKLTRASLFNDHCKEWGNVCQGGVSGGAIVKTLMQRQSCPAGYTGPTGGFCYAVSKPPPASKPLTEVGQCNDPGKPNGDAGMCYQNCPSGFKKSGPGECRMDAQTIAREKFCPAGYKDTAGMCYAVSSPPPDSKPLLEVGQCNDPGKPNGDAGMCYQNCPAGFKKSGPGECRMDAQTLSREPYCTEGYGLQASMCYAVSKPPPDSKPLLNVGECKNTAFPNGDAGMCYQNCADGFKKSGPGECRMDAETRPREKYCPEGYDEKSDACYGKVGQPPIVKPLVEMGECKDPSATFAENGSCYPPCPEGETREPGGKCKKAKVSKPREKFCPSGYVDQNGKCVGDITAVPKIDDVEKVGVCTVGNAEGRECWPDCPEGFKKTATGVCTKAQEVTKREKYCPEGYDQGADICTIKAGAAPEKKPLTEVGVCKDPEFSIASDGKCYPNCPVGYQPDTPGTCKKI